MRLKTRLKLREEDRKWQVDEEFMTGTEERMEIIKSATNERIRGGKVVDKKEGYEPWMRIGSDSGTPTKIVTSIWHEKESTHNNSIVEDPPALNTENYLYVIIFTFYVRVILQVNDNIFYYITPPMGKKVT